MSTLNTLSIKRSLSDLRAGHTAREALDAIYRAEGLEPPTEEQLANLPPWSEEDAAAFEKVINDMFERVDDDPHPL